MLSRTNGAIALCPTGNIQGGYFFMSLTTGRRVNQYTWTALPMPQDVIDPVHVLACRHLTDRGLLFTNRLGEAMRDHFDDAATDDTSYHPLSDDSDSSDHSDSTSDHSYHSNLTSEDSSYQPDSEHNSGHSSSSSSLHADADADSDTSLITDPTYFNPMDVEIAGVNDDDDETHDEDEDNDKTPDEDEDYDDYTKHGEPHDESDA
jgi:hypothetical protein